MSRSSCVPSGLTLLRRRRFLATAAATGLGFGTAMSAHANSGTSARRVPSELLPFAGASSSWRLQGSGTLRYFGFRAYDAYLWSLDGKGNPLLGQQPFALELEYSVSIKSEDIVKVSLGEMTRLRRLSEDQARTWNLEMQRSFPSVKPGDRVLGVQIPATGTRFFVNGRLSSEVNDPDFGQAFFAIWLDEKTRRPELRRELLGAPAEARGG